MSIKNIGMKVWRVVAVSEELPYYLAKLIDFSDNRSSLINNILT